MITTICIIGILLSIYCMYLVFENGKLKKQLINKESDSNIEVHCLSFMYNCLKDEHDKTIVYFIDKMLEEELKTKTKK